MATLNGILLDKLCFILHWGCVEIRSFLESSRVQQAIDLADVVEHIPGYIPSWSDEFLGIIADSFQRYRAKDEDKTFNYLAIWRWTRPSTGGSTATGMAL